MQKTSIEQLTAIKGYLRQMSADEDKTVEQIREQMAEAATKMPVIPETAYIRAEIGLLGGEWVAESQLDLQKGAQAILYFHGGGFVAGTSEFYRALAARISKCSGVKVLTVEYRLAPEHPYPAANEDCLHAYRWMLANGYSPRNIVFGGDSVGASLALMMLLSLRDAGQELPAGAFLLSPHTDLVNLDGESYVSRADLDPTGSLRGNQRILEAYLGSRVRERPAHLSPLRMDLRGLPRLLIQAGDHEVLLSDAVRFAGKAKVAGVEVSLEVWENMWTVFQLLAHMLPEARQAVEHIGQFVRTLLDDTGRQGSA